MIDEADGLTTTDEEGNVYRLTEECARCGGPLGHVDVGDNGEICDKCDLVIRAEEE